jgi:serine/threonine-protein kinase
MPRCPHCDQDHADGMHFCPVTGRPFVNVAERMIGRTVGGKYRLERAIGQGGMGTIFAARHTVIGTRVAVKVLHEHYAEKREPVQRLYREAQATGAVGHPSIIKVFDVGETADGIPFLVMELLEGESLGEHVERLGPRPLGFVLEVGIQMLSALHAAHRAGIIHRDLKSDNIFLLRDPEGGIKIKILDFGISKFTTPESENLRLTQTGSVLGTPYYMAPEQARGFKDLDRRIDLYAAGVILYELLLGTIPHGASNYNALLIEIITQDVQPFRELRPDVTERLEAAVLRALARNRDLRWPDAMSLMAELQTIRESIPSSVLRGDPPAIDRVGAGRWTRDSETMDFDSSPLEDLDGENRPASEAGASSGPGGAGWLHRRALLLGAGGSALAAGAVLAFLLAFGGDGAAPPQPEGEGPTAAREDAGPPLADPGPKPAPEPTPPDPGDAGAPEPGPAGERTAVTVKPKGGAVAKGGKAGKAAVASDGAGAVKAGDKGKGAPGVPKERPALDRPMDNPF